MGSFDVRCCISGIKMRHGTPIVLVPIIKSNDIGTCHTNSFYVPIMLPVHGKYNDYGGIEELEQTDKNIQAHNANKRAASSFFDMIDPYNKNNICDYTGFCNYRLKNFNKFVKYDSNNPEHYKLDGIEVAIFNKDIFEYAIQNSWKKHNIKESIKENTDKLLNSVKKDLADHDLFVKFCIESGSFLSGILERSYLRKHEHTDLLTDIINNNRENDHILSAVDDLSNVLCFMNETGKYLLPANNMGGQHWHEDSYKKETELNLFANKIMKKTIKDYNKKYRD